MSEDREWKPVKLPDGRRVSWREAQDIWRRGDWLWVDSIRADEVAERGLTFHGATLEEVNAIDHAAPLEVPRGLTKERKAQIEREHRERTRKRREPGSASVTRYRAYLESAAWQAKRLAALKRAGFVCLQCGSRDRLEVHHLSYERLGDELPADLTVLCARCHGFKHL